MASLTRGQTYTILKVLGWRIRTTSEGTQSVKNFQRAYNLGQPLDADGIVGPLTSAALLRSYAAHKAGRPDASPHFFFRDFACKCGGAYRSCQRIWVKRGLLTSLEVYRHHLGAPVSITSGCRCPGHNQAVGGVSASQHLTGAAADIHSPFPVATVAGWDLFAGLGYARSSSHVRHADRRDLTGSHASKSRPDRWVYTQW